MELKEFFKPTIVKLFLFILFFSVLVPFLYYENGCKNRFCGTATERVSCPPEGPIPIIFLVINFVRGDNCVTFRNVEKISTPFAILGFIATYLIACGIVALYYKIKK